MNMKTERFSNFTPKESKIVSLACMDVIHLIVNIVGYLKKKYRSEVQRGKMGHEPAA